MTATLTQTETLTEREPATGNGQFAHIVLNKRGEIPAAYVEGTPLEALCGHVWVPSKNPKTLPICPPCKAVWDDPEAVELANPNPTGRPLSDEIPK